jgi:hypothetical protein
MAGIDDNTVNKKRDIESSWHWEKEPGQMGKCFTESNAYSGWKRNGITRKVSFATIRIMASSGKDNQ